MISRVGVRINDHIALSLAGEMITNHCVLAYNISRSYIHKDRLLILIFVSSGVVCRKLIYPAFDFYAARIAHKQNPLLFADEASVPVRNQEKLEYKRFLLLNNSFQYFS